jgi:hypothetical protein
MLECTLCAISGLNEPPNPPERKICSLEFVFLIGKFSGHGGAIGPLFLGNIGVTGGLFIYYNTFDANI